MRRARPEEWYSLEGKGDGVTLISEPWIREFYRCNVWHVRGRDRDLLVDSGMGVVPLREWVPLVTERPLLAVASHTHFDHVGAHHEFEDRAVHEAEGIVRLNRGGSQRERSVGESPGAPLGIEPSDVDPMPRRMEGRSIEADPS